MNAIIFMCSLIAVVYCRPEDTYDSRYDNFDGAQVAGNVRLLKSYGKCFLGEGACTAEGHDFKSTIPDALRTNCAKCTPKQRELIRLIVKAFQSKTPELWQRLAHKEDPDGQYKESFQKFIEASD